MWRRKKFLVIGLLVALVLVGSTVGVVLAQTGSASDNQSNTLLARVAKILGIDQQKLDDAFTQAQSEMRDEALDNYLQNLVDQGKITKEQAEQYKTWCKSKPDMKPFQQQLKDWQNEKPDIPLPGPAGRLGGHGFNGDMKWGGGRCFYGR